MSPATPNIPIKKVKEKLRYLPAKISSRANSSVIVLLHLKALVLVVQETMKFQFLNGETYPQVRLNLPLLYLTRMPLPDAAFGIGLS